MHQMNSKMLALMGATLLPLPALAAETELVMNIFLPQQHFAYVALAEWGQKVEEVTEGRVAISIPAGSLAPPNQQYGAVTSGIADIAVTANIFIQRKEPAISVSQLPWITDSALDASVALWTTYEETLADKGLFDDVELLSLFNFAGGVIYSVDDAAINSVEDLKDRKMWALPGSSAKLLVEEGISPITTPAVQVSEPVSSGVVQGIFGLSIESARDFRIGSYIKAVTEFPTWISSTSFSMVMNSDKWGSLSEADRAAIKAISGGVLARKVGQEADAAYLKARQEFADAGVKFVSADEPFYGELQKAGEAIYAEFVKEVNSRGLDGAALVETFKANVQKASQ